MKAKGTVLRYGNDIDTDVIIPARYLNTSDPLELAKHCMEDSKEDMNAGKKPFYERVKKGDIIVADKNFGCGSSREHAPLAIKTAGVSCVIAKTFARIFYRNSINIGLPVLVCEDLHDNVAAGDEADIDLTAGTVKACGKEFTCTKLPEYMQNILNAGGLIASLNKEEN